MDSGGRLKALRYGEELIAGADRRQVYWLLGF